MMLASLLIGPLLGQSLGVSEFDVFQTKFAKAGWSTETIETSVNKCLIVKDSKKQTSYLFRFQKLKSGLRRFAGRDPNIDAHFSKAGDPLINLLEDYDAREMIQFAETLGVAKADAQVEVRLQQELVPVEIKPSPTVRSLSKTEGNTLVRILRAQGDVLRSIYGAGSGDGESIEELPYDTTMKRGFIKDSIIWLELDSVKNPIHVKYPVFAQLINSKVHVFFDHANSIEDVPFEVGFPELVSIHRSTKNLWDVWNCYEQNQGQAGLWFRSSLTTMGNFSVWSEQKRAEIVAMLRSKTKTLKGLVYAKSGRFAVAQFYDDDELKFAEIFDGAITSIKTPEEAILSIEGTTTVSRWWAYSGVCRQFGRGDVIRALYRTRVLAR